MPRPKKDWKIIVLHKNKKKGEFKGEYLLEALVRAEEKIIYNVEAEEYKEEILTPSKS